MKRAYVSSFGLVGVAVLSLHSLLVAANYRVLSHHRNSSLCNALADLGAVRSPFGSSFTEVYQLLDLLVLSFEYIFERVI